MTGMRSVLKRCLAVLSDSRLSRLHRHLTKGTPVLAGRPEAGTFFVHDGVADPIILACYDEPYPKREVVYADLHKQVADIYYDVAFAVPHSGYANSLEELTQWDVKQIVKELMQERGLLGH